MPVTKMHEHKTVQTNNAGWQIRKPLRQEKNAFPEPPLHGGKAPYSTPEATTTPSGGGSLGLS
jgi:hypothetical protein